MFKNFRRFALGCQELATAAVTIVGAYYMLDQMGVIDKVAEKAVDLKANIEEKIEKAKENKNK